MRSKKPVDGNDSQRNNGAKNSAQPASSQVADNDDNDINPDDIDWNSLSKSERRRLRKKLRRQGGQAA